MRLLSLVVVLLLPGCSLLGTDDDPEVAANRLAEALSDLSLDGVALAEPGAAEAFAARVEPLSTLDADVTVGDVSDDDETATAQLHWTWTVDDRDFTYETTAYLVQQDDEWLVDWRPETLAPGLTSHERIELIRTPMERGEIRTADGRAIVTARPVLRYGLDKAQVEPDEVNDRAAEIADAIDIDAESFQAAAESAGERAFVEGIVLRAEEARARVDPDFGEIPGALVVEDSMALAPTRGFAAALLGRVGPATAEIVDESAGRIQPGDDTGLSGLQRHYDEHLSGAPSYEVAAVPVEECPEWPKCAPTGDRRTLVTLEGEAGRPLGLTLDIDLQLEAEAILESAGDEDAPASAIVALRPSTGEVLVAANGPGNGGLNAATSGQYAPGSTFKVVTSLALLRAGVSPEQILSCPTTIEVDGRRFKNYSDYPSSGIGDITFMTAIAQSCNTALIGARDLLTDNDLTEAAAALGLGVDHDLGFPAYFGQVPPPSGETEKAADLIGQGKVLASPLAMATVAASVQAGRAVVPRLFVDDSPVAEPAHPLTPAEAGQLQELMRAVVTEGSGRFLSDVSGDVGAKTGTAEYGEPGDDGSLETHAWMIATHGDLAVAVFVETGDSGSQTAGPLLAEFLR